MIWFTSDLHLGHTNIAGPDISNWKDGYRTFKSVSEMDQELLKQLNALVAPDDTLYYLGDFTFKGQDTVKSYRDRILCKNIVFIRGNHDKRSSIASVFGHCYDYVEEEFEGVKFCMSHYAMRVWNKSHRNAIHLYGHSHSMLEGEEWGRSMDVGVDNAYKMYGVYCPFSLDTIMKIMNKRVPKVIDHHGASKDKMGNKRFN